MLPMVKFIPAELTLELRSNILRNGLPPVECVFPTDHVEGAFHLGYFADQELATIASFFPQRYRDQEGEGFQLRGMATDLKFLGKGFGKQVVEFSVEYVRTTNAKYIWCNARTSAVKFYEKLEFRICSNEFEIAGVGPHYEMILNLY